MERTGSKGPDPGSSPEEREARRRAMEAVWSRYGSLRLEKDTDQLLAELRDREEVR